jgi:hypothetical protein
LLDGVHAIEMAGQPCLYDDCLTKNPIVRRTDRSVIERDLLRRGLTRTDLPGRSRIDINLDDPVGESRRLLFEVSDIYDFEAVNSPAPITIATLAFVFATRYGPGGEMLIAEPYAFVVASSDAAYRRQLELQYDNALHQIIQRLRLAH